jgi:hypothetical protein
MLDVPYLTNADILIVLCIKAPTSSYCNYFLSKDKINFLPLTIKSTKDPHLDFKSTTLRMEILSFATKPKVVVIIDKLKDI